jgi:hypothetical protein
MKSGPADEHTLEEDVALPLPPIFVIIGISTVVVVVIRLFVFICMSSAAAAAPDKPNNDVRATLPAAVMSAAAHVTSSSSVAINTASWTASCFYNTRHVGVLSSMKIKQFTSVNVKASFVTTDNILY